MFLWELGAAANVPLDTHPGGAGVVTGPKLATQSYRTNLPLRLLRNLAAVSTGSALLFMSLVTL